MRLLRRWQTPILASSPLQVRMNRRNRRVVVLLPWLLLLVSAGLAHADVVVPSDDVVTRVVVREGPSSSTSDVGSLRPGEQAELTGSVPNWYEVRLANGTPGFVSKRWTRVIATGKPPSGPQPTGLPTFTLDVVDVGTGLGVLVRGVDFTLVYDGGSNDDLARGEDNRMLAYVRSVLPSLKTIDHMILSHPHRDHVELLPDLFDEYEVRHVWDSGRVNDICGYRAFLTRVRDEPGVEYHNALQDFGTQGYSFGEKRCYGNQLPAETLQLTHSTRITAGVPITLGQGASMTVLHADGANHSSANENSVVVRLDLGTARVLLMGDAEAGGRKHPSQLASTSSIEGGLLACCTSDLAADVLVVGHHGSMTSSRRAFLDAVGASMFIVSAGPTPYGSGKVVLPDDVVIEELELRGQVFRTDVDDEGCRTSQSKVGPTADGAPGGCSNIRVSVGPSGAVVGGSPDLPFESSSNVGWPFDSFPQAFVPCWFPPIPSFGGPRTAPLRP